MDEVDEVDEVECSKCGKTTSAKYVYASTCLNCAIKDRMTYPATTPSGLSGYRRGGMIFPYSKYPTYASSSSDPEEITYYTWGGIPTHKVSPPPSEEAEAEAEAEAEKPQYVSIHEDLANLRDQSQLAVLIKMRDELSVEHDAWVKKIANEVEASTASYMSGVVGGLGEAIYKLNKMIAEIKNDS